MRAELAQVPAVAASAAPTRGRVFGLTVRSSFPIPALGDGCGSASPHESVCVEQSVADLDLGWPTRETERLVDLRFPDGRLFMGIEHDPERGYRIWAPRHGRHIVSPDGHLIRSALPQRAARAWQRLFFAQTLPLAAALQGLEVLHASAVTVQGRALAFTAASGTGKSSLAAHLVAGGATFLTDDVLALERQNGRVLAHPGPTRIGVYAHELETMTKTGRGRLGQRRRGREKLELEPRPASGPAPLAFLHRVDRSPRFTRLRLREQLPPKPKDVLASSFLAYLRTGDRLLNQLAVCEQIAATVRLYDLEIPASVPARDAAAFVLEHATGALT